MLTRSHLISLNPFAIFSFLLYHFFSKQISDNSSHLKKKNFPDVTPAVAHFLCFSRHLKFLKSCLDLPVSLSPLLLSLQSDFHPRSSTDSSCQGHCDCQDVKLNGHPPSSSFLQPLTYWPFLSLFGILHLPSRKPLSWVFSCFIGHSPLCLFLLVFLTSKFWSIPIFRSQTSSLLYLHSWCRSGLRTKNYLYAQTSP